MPLNLRAKTSVWLGFGFGLWLAVCPTRGLGQRSPRLTSGTSLADDQGSARFVPVRIGTSRPVTISPVIAPSGLAAVSAASSDELTAMAGRAGVIFAGHVLLIMRNDAAGFVDVRFHIDQAIRGCPATGAYVMREWAGLWTGKAPRYRVGESLLLLLTARGPSGMNAPLGGAAMEGAIHIVAEQLPPLAHGTGVTRPESGVSRTPPNVDLRWVEALAPRAVTHAPRIVRLHPLTGGQQPGTARSFKAEAVPIGAWSDTASGPQVEPLVAGAAHLLQQPSLDAVLLLLRGVHGANHATR